MCRRCPLSSRALCPRSLLARRRWRCSRDVASHRHRGVMSRRGISDQVGRDVDLARLQLRDLGAVVGALGAELSAGVGQGRGGWVCGGRFG